MVKLAIWNNDYISVRSTLACQPRGVWGYAPPGNSVLKIRPSKGESDSVISSFSVKFQFIKTLTFILNQDCLQYALSSHHACMIMFHFRVGAQVRPVRHWPDHFSATYYYYSYQFTKKEGIHKRQSLYKVSAYKNHLNLQKDRDTLIEQSSHYTLIEQSS